MTQVAHIEPRYTAQRYLELVQAGVLGPDDRVELLEGVIVAMVPQNPRHAAAIGRVDDALRDAIGKRAVVSVQLPLIAGTYSVPEPDKFKIFAGLFCFFIFGDSSVNHGDHDIF